MDPADRDDELVAHAASEGTRLCKRKVMRIRRHAAAHKAGLTQHEFPVVLIAEANSLAQSTDGAAERPLLGRSLLALAGRRSLVGDSVRRPDWDQTIRRPARGRTVRGPVRGPSIADRGEPRLKPLLDYFRVCGRQRVLGRQIAMRPGRRLVRRIYSGCRLSTRRSRPPGLISSRITGEGKASAFGSHKGPKNGYKSTRVSALDSAVERRRQPADNWMPNPALDVRP
jgi:hypothetical protein